MKLTVLSNEFDDCLLYINDVAHQDIDYRWAECILWLSDKMPDDVIIEHKKFPGERVEFPEPLSKSVDIRLKMKDRWEIHDKLEKTHELIAKKMYVVTNESDHKELAMLDIQMDKLKKDIIRA